MKKEEWIDDVLGSAKQIEKVNAPPFLVEKIMSRIQTAKPELVRQTGFVKWALAFGIVLFIALNVITLQKNLKGNGEAKREAGMSEYNHSVIYNY
jgi:hypothetical protein